MEKCRCIEQQLSTAYLVKHSKEDTRLTMTKRILKDISPIPQKIMEVRKRSKQVGKVLTSEEHIALRKDKENEKTLKEQRRKVKQEKKND